MAGSTQLTARIREIEANAAAWELYMCTPDELRDEAEKSSGQYLDLYENWRYDIKGWQNIIRRRAPARLALPDRYVPTSQKSHDGTLESSFSTRLIQSPLFHRPVSDEAWCAPSC